MILRKLSIEGAYISSHKIHCDNRGYFREWFKNEEPNPSFQNFEVQQANFSKSKKWVIRGIHYSLAPKGQEKIVTCVGGEIIDVLVDLRIGSSSFLAIEYVNLKEDNGDVIFIPNGVGHGFIVISNSASVVYLTSSTYSPNFERAIQPFDPELGIKWALPEGTQGLLSINDEQAPSLAEITRQKQLPIFVDRKINDNSN